MLPGRVALGLRRAVVGVGRAIVVVIVSGSMATSLALAFVLSRTNSTPTRPINNAATPPATQLRVRTYRFLILKG